VNKNRNSDLTREASAAGRHRHILVIGYGNPLRSDDGIGWRIAHELRGRLDTSRIEVIECHQLAPEMADKIRLATLVIFVDAALEGFPGEVRHHRLDGMNAEVPSMAFSHGRTPCALMALAADLYAASPEAHLFTVSGSLFRYGEALSREVEHVFPLVVAEIESLIGAAESGIAAR